MTFLIVLYVIAAVGLVASVLAQEGKSAGLGAVAGGVETTFSKKKGRDELFSRFTTILALIFLALNIAIVWIQNR
ncbi:MAG TPA: preprotein translocase subunit SecG [Symbiobacteriaceae bacterium]|nr:preprotein translocase subunit SecG [Symbiobacteriaceae bacterium]